MQIDRAGSRVVSWVARGCGLIVFFLLANPLVTLASGPPASAKEAGGVRLGMTLEEVRSALAKQKPVLKIQSEDSAAIPGQPGKTFVSFLRAAASPPAQETTTVFFSPPPSRVVVIGRTVGYAKDSAPTVDDVNASLAQKFGPTSTPSRWVWTAAGAPISDTMKVTGCLMTADTSFIDYPATALAIPGRLGSIDCGVVVAAAPSADGKIAMGVSMKITDLAAIKSAIEKLSAAVNEAQQRQDQEALEKAKKNRPKL
jgi:hypothetical protein